jgi:hypothetical protein
VSRSDMSLTLFGELKASRGDPDAGPNRSKNTRNINLRVQVRVEDRGMLFEDSFAWRKLAGI